MNAVPGLMARKGKRSKYNAKPTTVDGVRFASQKEALHYITLKQMERSGKITGLELQPKFDLRAWMGGLEFKESAIVGRYIADFRYFVPEAGQWIVEDCKGFRTDVYKLKKKIVEANYGITIREV